MYGTPVLAILGIVFVTLKLCGVIAWPWLWVLAPFWIGFAILLLIAAIFVIGLVIAWAIARSVNW